MNECHYPEVSFPWDSQTRDPAVVVRVWSLPRSPRTRTLQTWASRCPNSNSTHQPHPQTRPIVGSLQADHKPLSVLPSPIPHPCKARTHRIGQDPEHQRPPQAGTHTSAPSAGQYCSDPDPACTPGQWPAGKANMAARALVTATVKGRAAQEVLGGAEGDRTPGDTAQVHGHLRPRRAPGRSQPLTSRPPGLRACSAARAAPARRPAPASPHFLTSQRAHPPLSGRSH